MGLPDASFEQRCALLIILLLWDKGRVLLFSSRRLFITRAVWTRRLTLGRNTGAEELAKGLPVCARWDMG